MIYFLCSPPLSAASHPLSLHALSFSLCCQCCSLRTCMVCGLCAAPLESLPSKRATKLTSGAMLVRANTLVQSGGVWSEVRRRCAEGASEGPGPGGRGNNGRVWHLGIWASRAARATSNVHPPPGSSPLASLARERGAGGDTGTYRFLCTGTYRYGVPISTKDNIIVVGALRG